MSLSFVTRVSDSVPAPSVVQVLPPPHLGSVKLNFPFPIVAPPKVAFHKFLKIFIQVLHEKSDVIAVFILPGMVSITAIVPLKASSQNLPVKIFLTPSKKPLVHSPIFFITRTRPIIVLPTKPKKAFDKRPIVGI